MTVVTLTVGDGHGQLHERYRFGYADEIALRTTIDTALSVLRANSLPPPKREPAGKDGTA